MDESKEKTWSLEKEKLERLINMSECGILVVRMDAEPEILYANDCFYENLQYTREEYIAKYGKQAMATVVPEEKQKIKALIARQSTAGGNIHLEFQVVRKDGSIIWVAFAAKRELMQGQIVYYCSCLNVSASKRHLEDVYKAKKEVELIANSIPGGVIKLRMSDFKLLYANDGFFRLAGYSRAEYSMKFQNCVVNLLHPADEKWVGQAIRQAVNNRGPLGIEYRIIAKNGETRWSYVNGTRIDDEGGEAVYLCVIVDITSRKQAEKELADNNHRSEIITTMLKETIWTYDVGKRLLYRSGNLGATYSPESVLEGSFDEQHLKRYIHPEDVERFIKIRNAWLSKTGEYRDVVRVQNEKGDYQRVEICTHSEAESGDKPDKVYGITRLIAENSQPMYLEEEVIPKEVTPAEGKLLKMAKTAQAEAEDTITGLLPYASFLKRAEKALAERKEEEHYALVCADINEFRKFSHHYGFSISNRILKIFSKVLLKNLANDGMCARVDGDYFVVLFKYRTHKELLKAMSAVVRRQEELEKTEEDGMEFGSTIGLYLVQKEDHELLDMLERADLARRSIKGLVGNHYAIYTEEVAAHLSHEDEQIAEIQNAWQQHQVDICYLPRIQGDKEHIIGSKAIPRILMKNGQYLEYKQIMHLMERGGQLEGFSFYLLEEVARSMGSWKARGRKIMPVSLEMTASQLSTTRAVSRIDEIVKKNDLKPENFLFEIPERFFEGGTSAFELAVEQLSKRGYGVIISRFGTDHTAIHTLRRLPVTGIKFHGEYFQEHMINEKDIIVLKKTTEMAREMGLRVHCGGVQTRLQEEFARKIGCDILEGDYYYGAMRGNVFEKCFLSE